MGVLQLGSDIIAIQLEKYGQEFPSYPSSISKSSSASVKLTLVSEDSNYDFFTEPCCTFFVRS